MFENFNSFGLKDRIFLYLCAAGLVTLFVRLIFFDLEHGSEAIYSVYCALFYLIPSFSKRYFKAFTHSIVLFAGLILSRYEPRAASSMMICFYYIQLELRSDVSWICLIYILIALFAGFYTKNGLGAAYTLLLNFVFQKGYPAAVRSTMPQEKPKDE